MLKTLMFPYTYDSYYLYQNRKYLKPLDIQGVFSPRGSGLEGEDADDLMGGFFRKGLYIREDFEDAIKDFDAVLFCEGLKTPELYLQKISYTRTFFKKIYVTPKVKTILQNNNFPMHDINLLKEFTLNFDMFIKFNKNLKNKIYNVDVPVLFILNEGVHCNSIDIELKLRDKFVTNKYKVSQIGSQSESNIFGFISAAEILNLEVSFGNKVILFNHYLHYLNIVEKPDLFIIGLPDAILPFDELNNNNFSEQSLIISSAIHPDISILCTYFILNIDDNYLNKIKDYCKYKFNSICDYIFMSSTVVNFDEEISNKINYLHMRKEEIELKNNLVFGYYNLDLMIEKIFEKLVGNCN